ncbi:MAG: MFS transporter [Neobacillus sp.]
MKAAATLEQLPSEKAPKDKIGFVRMGLWQSQSISMACNVIIIGFLMIYCTDTLKMPAALVGTLLMASKLFDGVTDLFAGFLVDRTNTKMGRGRPYSLSIIGVWICTWLMFAVPPEYSLFAKSAWVFVTYVFVNAVFATFLNASGTVYMVRAFSKQEHYVAISSYGNIFVLLAVVVVNVSFPMALGNLATSPEGWKTLIAIYGIPLLLIGLLRFFFIKETNNVDVEVGQKISLKDVGTVLKTNRYIYIIAIMTFVSNFVGNMGVNVYYFTYIVKDIGLMGPLALTQIVILPVLFSFPAIIRKFSTKKLIIAGIFLTSLGYLINFIAGDNFGILVVGAILTGAGSVPVSMLAGLLIIECAEYNEWKGKHRMEGTLTSITSFTTKLGAAAGTGILGILLSIAGHTGDLATQPESAEMMIRLLFGIVPMALFLLTALVLRFYKLDVLMPRILEENEERRNNLKMK